MGRTTYVVRGNHVFIAGQRVVAIRSSDEHVFEMLGHLAIGDFCQILSDLADDFGANVVGDRCPQIA